MAQGLYRDTGGWAQVDYEGKFSRAVRREDYEKQGLKPAFASLPTKESFLKKPAAKSAAAKPAPRPAKAAAKAPAKPAPKARPKPKAATGKPVAKPAAKGRRKG